MKRKTAKNLQQSRTKGHAVPDRPSPNWAVNISFTLKEDLFGDRLRSSREALRYVRSVWRDLTEDSFPKPLITVKAAQPKSANAEVSRWEVVMDSTKTDLRLWVVVRAVNRVQAKKQALCEVRQTYPAGVFKVFDCTPAD